MKRAQFIIITFLVLLLIIGGIVFFGQQKGDSMNKSLSSQPSVIPKPNGRPHMSIDPAKSYIAILHTDVGDIKIHLLAKETPVTVNNFVNLTKDKFYDGTVFHRVIKGFMIQGGDPQGSGRGGPGYQFDDEKFTGEYTRGVVAMANAGPNTNGSQFFIMHADYKLPKNYVIFGNVVEGMETVDTIANSEVVDGGSGEKSKPVKPVNIKTAEIIENANE